MEKNGIENLFPQKTIERIKNEIKEKNIKVKNYKKHLQESICKSEKKDDFVNFETLLREIKDILEK